MKALFTPETWISWVVAMATSAAMLSAYLHSTFETKADAKENRDAVGHQMERIDNKLDRLIELLQHSR